MIPVYHCWAEVLYDTSIPLQDGAIVQLSVRIVGGHFSHLDTEVLRGECEGQTIILLNECSSGTVNDELWDAVIY